MLFFFFSSRRRHTRLQGDWSSDVCSSDLSDREPVDALLRIDPPAAHRCCPGPPRFSWSPACPTPSSAGYHGSPRPKEPGKPEPKKIVVDPDSIDALLVDLFLEAHQQAPDQIILDLDATDDTLYGRQEGRFYHGYYHDYCYLPLYVFCGEHLLCAR